MRKKLLSLLLAAAAALALAGCAKNPGPPPDLTGGWIQLSQGEWFHIATITNDTIEIWWYLPAEDERNLYWSGTFTPPEDGKEPYTWTSANNYTEEELNRSYTYNRTSREETKEFSYKNGQISYNVTSGHLRLGYTLERAE
ncbi:MAG: hypothetical protein IJV43_02680 [Oscillospiraceae bacterium]|nr:hypothetical protein [Oscillospiraceae bacterium]